jgi:hypothetical protein
MVTIRQSDSEAIASEAATASLSRGDAAVTAEQLKPAAPEDRVMGPNPWNLEADEMPALAGESPALCGFVTTYAGKIAAGIYRKTAKSGRSGRYARYPGNSSPFFSEKLRRHQQTQISGGALNWTSALQAHGQGVANVKSAALGRRSMVTKPGTCSTRLSQARTAGNADRS